MTSRAKPDDFDFIDELERKLAKDRAEIDARWQKIIDKRLAKIRKQIETARRRREERG